MQTGISEESSNLRIHRY